LSPPVSILICLLPAQYSPIRLQPLAAKIDIDSRILRPSVATLSPLI
jgi:hypothetical protein